MDGDGGPSTGGVCAVSGTIGPPDAGTMSGGSFTLRGGFQGVVAVRTPGTPLLSILRAVAEGWRLARTNALPRGAALCPPVALVTFLVGPEGLVDFTDSALLGRPRRFYRAAAPWK